MEKITLEVLDTKLDGLADLFLEKFKTNGNQHQDILNANGKIEERVEKVEVKCTETDKWKSKASGVFLVFNMFLLPVLFIFISIFVSNKFGN